MAVIEEKIKEKKNKEIIIIKKKNRAKTFNAIAVAVSGGTEVGACPASLPLPPSPPGWTKEDINPACL